MKLIELRLNQAVPATGINRRSKILIPGGEMSILARQPLIFGDSSWSRITILSCPTIRRKLVLSSNEIQ